MGIHGNIAMMVMQERREVARDQVKTGAQTTLRAELEQRAAEVKASKGELARIVGLIDDVVTTAVKTVGKVGDFQDALKGAASTPVAEPKAPEGTWEPALLEAKKSAYGVLSTEEESKHLGELRSAVGGSREAERGAAGAHARTAEELAALIQDAVARTRALV